MSEAKIKLIGAVGVKVRPDANGFRGETQRALNKELMGLSKNIAVKGDVRLDTGKARSEIRNLQRQITALSSGVRLNLETRGIADLKRYNDALAEYKEKAEAAAKASDKYFGANKNHTERIKADEEALASRRKLVEASKDLATSWNELNLKPLDLKIVNPAQIDEQLAHVHRNFRAMKDDADDLAQHIEHLDPKMDIDLAGTEMAAARLAYASRPRTVPFFVTVNAKSLAIAEGMLKSLSGLNVLESAGRHLEDLLINFDKATIKGSLMATVIGNITNAVAWFGTSTFSAAGGIAEMVGLLATAPAGIAAFASAITINVAAWKNFKGAIDGDVEALAALPPAARDAAVALQGTWTQIQKPVQRTFWDGMGTAMQDAVEHLLPQVESGLTRTSTHVGRFTAEVINSFTRLAQSGGLEEMFDGLETFFDNAARGAGPLMDALNILGMRGSHYLGVFGESLADAAERFRDWIQEADDANKITAWIENGTKATKDLWSSLMSTVDIFQALTKAADTAGAGGLVGLRDSLRDIADMMDGEPFQSRLSNIFEGARRGATNLNVGVKDLGRTFGESSEEVSYMLELLGSIGGMTLTNVASAISQPKLQGGIIAGLQGMRDLLRDLEPGFDSLGRIIGNFASMSGGVLSGVGTPLSEILGLLDDIVDTVADELTEAVPALTGGLSAFVALLSGPLQLGADVLEGVLQVFNALPEPIQDAVVALGALVAFRTSLGSMFHNVRSSSMSAFSSLHGYVRQADGSLKDMHGNTVTMARALEQLGPAGQKSFPFLRAAWSQQRDMIYSGNDAIRQYAFSIRDVGAQRVVIGRLGTAFTDLRNAGQQLKLEPGTAAIRNLGTAALGSAGHIGMAAGAGLRGAMSGLMGVLGGPWGLALAAGAVAVSAFAQNQAEAKQRTEELGRTLEETTGAVTNATKAFAVDRLLEGRGGFNGWIDDLLDKHVDAKKALDEIGVSVSKAADLALEGGPAYDEMIAALEKLERMEPENEAYDVAIDRLKELRDSTREQQEETRRSAEAMNLTEPSALRMADAMEKIRSNTASATEKVDAMVAALEILKGEGEVSARASEMNAQRVINAQMESARSLAEGIANSNVALNDATGMLNKLHPQAVEIYGDMTQLRAGLLENARAAYDAAIADGATASTAAEEARKIIAGNEELLAEYARNAGVPVDALRREWQGLLGEDWEVEAAITGTADQLRAAMAEADRLGIEFDGKEFMAWIMAQNDPTKVSIDEAIAWMQQFEQREAVAKITGDPDGFNAIIQAAEEKGARFSTQTFTSWLDANLDKFKDKEMTAEQLGELFATYIFEAGFDGDKSAFEAERSSAIQSGQGFGRERYTATLAGTRTPFESEKGAAMGSGANFALNWYYANLSAQNATGDAVAAADQYLLANWSGRKYYAKLDATKEITAANGAFLTSVYANGGINGLVKRYASGGTENHVAQIARGQTPYRVWAEPETGGEAYIPLASSKRARSTSILNQVATHFGLSLVPNSVSMYANGGTNGLTPSDRTGAGVAVNIGSYVTQKTDTPDDIARALMRRIKAQGAYSPLEAF